MVYVYYFTTVKTGKSTIGKRYNENKSTGKQKKNDGIKVFNTYGEIMNSSSSLQPKVDYLTKSHLETTFAQYLHSELFTKRRRFGQFTHDTNYNIVNK